MLDVASGTVTAIAASGRSPRWSPDGESVAYLVTGGFGDDLDGQLVVSARDGSNARTISARAFSPGLTWSPDGRYVLARSAGEYVLRVVRVNDGRDVALRLGATAGPDSPYFESRDYFQPDWR